MFSRFLKSLATWVYRHHVLVLIVAVLLTVIAIFLTSQLGISSNIGSLLPEHTESIQVLKKASKRIGAMGYLMVVVEGSDTDEMKAFAVDFSNELLLERDKLRRQGKESFVRFVDYKNPIEFFEDRFLLYLSLDDLTDIRDRISKRIKKEKIAANPFFVKLSDDEDDDEDDGDIMADVTFEDMKEKYKTQYDVKGFSEWYLYEKDDVKILSILVLPTKGSSDLEFDDQLLDFVGGVSQRVMGTGAYPHIKSVELGGSYRNKRGQKNSIRNDLLSSIILTLILLFIIITVFFRKLRAVWLILLPLVMAIFWTLAIGYLRFDKLNMITAFIFAVLLGLGIDFGIHLLARYFEERRDKGLDVLTALQNMLTYTGRATWVGAITTMVAFFALTIADFKGFSEFGFLAGFGVMACVISMLTVFPALLVFTERLRPVQKRERPRTWLKLPAFLAQRSSVPGYRIMLLLGLTVIGLGLYHIIISAHCTRDDWCSDKYRCCPQEQTCCGDGNNDVCKKTAKVCKKFPEKCCPVTARECCEPTLQFEYHFGRLRDKKPIGRAITKKYHKSFKLSLQPLNLLVEDVSQVQPVTDVIQKKIDTNKDTTIDTVRSLGTWIPEQQDEKQKVLAEIAELIKPKKIDFLDDDVKKRIDEFRPKLHVSNITLYQLPEKVLLWHSVVRTGYEGMLPLVKELLGDLPGDAKRNEWMAQARMRSANLSPERITEALEVLRNNPDEWIKKRDGDIVATSAEAPRAERAEELIQRMWLFNERNIGILLKIYTRIDTYNAKAAIRFADEAGEIMVGDERFVPAGEALIYADTIRAMEKDGMLAIIASAIAILLILLLDFRSLRRAATVLIPLVTGILGMLAIMGAFNIKINFYNMIVITSIIGIGIDNGVHIYYRYREMGPGNAWAALRSVFGAVTLASVTTMIGFSGMLTANNRGLNSIGELAIIGMVSCWLAAVTVLPAFLEFRDRKLQKAKPAAEKASHTEAA